VFTFWCTIALSLDTTEASEMNKIAVKGPIVELDGDEMTRIIWKKIREEVSILYFIVILQEVFQLPVCASIFASCSPYHSNVLITTTAYSSISEIGYQVLRSGIGVPR
jgi:hypothetical protein